MADYQCIVPGFEKRLSSNRVVFGPGSPEIEALQRAYPGITFSSLTAWDHPPHTLMKHPEIDLVAIHVTVRGRFDDLVDWQFAHRSWRALPPGGYRQYITKGFGSADVHRLKSGQYALRYLYLDHMCEMLMGPLMPLHWTPAPRTT